MVDSLKGKGLRNAVFVTNGVILIGGLILFSVGVWFLLDFSIMKRILGTDLYVGSAVLMIFSGGVLALHSFLGCLGAYKENRTLLLIFLFILFFTFVLIILGILLGFAFKIQVGQKMHREMIIKIRLYNNDSAVTQAWDYVQEQFKCCGVSMNGRKGFTIYQRYNRQHFIVIDGKAKVPRSCCSRLNDQKAVEHCVQDPTNANYTYHDDCYEKLIDFVEGRASIVDGIGFGMACVLIMGMGLSMALYLNIG